VLDRGELPQYTHAVYEGQLANPEVAVAKVQQVLEAGFQPVITVVHTPPEKALDNTLQRFQDIGRGASVNVMAMVQGGLPQGLAAVHQHFGDAVELRILDRREFDAPKEWKGWHHLPVLESEGTHEQIKQRLLQHLENQRERLPEAAWRQAAGLAPLGQDRYRDAGHDRQHEGPGEEREPAQKDREKTLLAPTPAPAALSARDRFQQGFDKGLQTPVTLAPLSAADQARIEAEHQQRKQAEHSREQERDGDKDYSL